ESLMRENSNRPEVLTLAGMLYTEINLTQTELRNPPAAAEAAASGMEVARRLAALHPSDQGPRSALANAYMSLGRALLASQKLEESATAFRDAVGLREQLVKEQPYNVEYRRELMVSYGTLGDVEGFRTGENLGDAAGAAAAFRQSLEIAQWLRDQDPADSK